MTASYLLSEEGREVELTQQDAERLEYSEVIYQCDECSENRDAMVFHTTHEWDNAALDGGWHPVDGVLAVLRGT